MTRAAKLRLQYITDYKGRKKGVVLSIREFNELLEDLQDLAVIAERKDEPNISHEDALRSLKVQGALRAP